MSNEIKNAKENVKTSIQESILTVSINITKDFGPSKSGKSNMIATTGGFLDLGDGVSLNLNLVRKKN